MLDGGRKYTLESFSLLTDFPKPKKMVLCSESLIIFKNATKGKFSGKRLRNNVVFYKVLVQVPFTTSKMGLNMGYKKSYLRVASQVAN